MHLTIIPIYLQVFNSNDSVVYKMTNANHNLIGTQAYNNMKERKPTIYGSATNDFFSIIFHNI